MSYQQPASVSGPPWSQGPAPESVPELLAEISSYAATQMGGVLWRGQASKSWGLSSSLWRLLGNPNEEQMRIAERATLMSAHAWGIGIHPTGIEVDHQVLAALQHHGAWTRLMDVTSNPWVALWFACATSGTDDGVVFGIRRTDLEVLRTGGPAIHRHPTYGSASDPVGWHYRSQLDQSAQDRMPFVVDPVIRNDRIRAQGGMFLTWAVSERGVAELGGLSAERLSLGKMADEVESQPAERGLRISTVVIPADIKQEVRRVLAESYDISTSRLFPDVQGLVEHLRGQPPTKIPVDEFWMAACKALGLSATVQGAAVQLRLGTCRGLLLPDARGGVTIEFVLPGEVPTGWQPAVRPTITGDGTVVDVHVADLPTLASRVESLQAAMPKERDGSAHGR